ncbi:DUF1667 domain-containing protein [Anoxynatronum buryatiense]|uniref:CxxC motif-containing protein n=1 Tax=Anoxynatronum buryatiense TaxID=489973 RepID=A0AA45WYG0_9CLOT|nr:DUF1667 domain-containing protein [Anoxynatronum buryatiense]SMP67324.1 CxxC motif-containing protein [Anoxynatronum buryatiense]
MNKTDNQHSTMTCIVCPMGCHLDIEHTTKEGNYQVTGNQCPRGEQYAIEEITHPTRMLTTTVKLNHGNVTRLPVKTAQPVPKALLYQCMQQLNQLEVEAPVKQGQVLIKNLLNTGVDVIATRSA